MNNLYHWQDEVMVNLEMDELRKEIDKIRLLNDAGLSNPSLLDRISKFVGGALARAGKHLHVRAVERHQAYQVTSSKYAA